MCRVHHELSRAPVHLTKLILISCKTLPSRVPPTARLYMHVYRSIQVTLGGLWGTPSLASWFPCSSPYFEVCCHCTSSLSATQARSLLKRIATQIEDKTISEDQGREVAMTEWWSWTEGTRVASGEQWKRNGTSRNSHIFPRKMEKGVTAKGTSSLKGSLQPHPKTKIDNLNLCLCIFVFPRKLRIARELGQISNAQKEV